MLPLLTASLPTESLSRSEEEEDGSGFCDLAFPPRLEKFHFPPGVWIKWISGWSSTRSLTLSCLEKISGISSTPTFRLLARTKGSLLNAGSSAIERSSAETLPDKIDRPKLPTWTSRPSALVKVDSSLGRKLFTLMMNGRMMTTTRMSARRIPTIFRVFIRPSLDAACRYRAACGWMCGLLSLPKGDCLPNFGVLRGGFHYF